MEELERGSLYVVATPIGNLGDLSPRAVQVLEGCDFVAAEDTRVTLKLLNHFGIKKPLVSCYREVEQKKSADLIDRLLSGEICALTCDAGTPAVSDPGTFFVREAKNAGIAVHPVPGCCAAIAALSASGMNCSRFCFEGFLSVSKRSRREHLAALENEPRAMLFYEAPHKLRATLQDFLDTFGDRPITIARELTKLHEEIRNTTLSEACEYYRERDPRGEFVLIVGGKEKSEPEAVSIEEALARVASYHEEGRSLSDACRSVSAETGIRKSILYKQASEAKL